jgi:hypothetical protein
MPPSEKGQREAPHGKPPVTGKATATPVPPAPPEDGLRERLAEFYEAAFVDGQRSQVRMLTWIGTVESYVEQRVAALTAENEHLRTEVDIQRDAREAGQRALADAEARLAAVEDKPGWRRRALATASPEELIAWALHRVRCIDMADDHDDPDEADFDRAAHIVDALDGTGQQDTP